jgi:hypothetical protein
MQPIAHRRAASLCNGTPVAGTIGMAGDRSFQELPTMNAACWDSLSSVDANDTPRRAYLFRGNAVTAACSKLKTLLTLNAKFAQRPPGPFGADEPPEGSKVEDMWNDPMFWIMVGLH